MLLHSPMVEITISIPEDISIEFDKISKEAWQLLFSRFVKSKLDELRKIEAIISKSKATEKQISELAEEVGLEITKRLLKE